MGGWCTIHKGVLQVGYPQSNRGTIGTMDTRTGAVIGRQFPKQHKRLQRDVAQIGADNRQCGIRGRDKEGPGHARESILSKVERGNPAHCTRKGIRQVDAPILDGEEEDLGDGVDRRLVEGDRDLDEIVTGTSEQDTSGRKRQDVGIAVNDSLVSRQTEYGEGGYRRNRQRQGRAHVEIDGDRAGARGGTRRGCSKYKLAVTRS